MARFDIRSFALGTAIALLVALGAPASVFAAGTIPISQVPLFSTTGVPPLMLIVMSRDEQLYMKAYSDYTDLDGDGQIDATYNNAFAYSGYFDSDLCYGYNSGVFKAAAAASNSAATARARSAENTMPQCSAWPFVASVMRSDLPQTRTDTSPPGM